jgi:hypothetical protein
MLWILFEYLWDICACGVFLAYPVLAYKKHVSKKKTLIFYILCLTFYESDWSSVVYYAAVWQLNYWMVYDQKYVTEPYAIAIYCCYKAINFTLVNTGPYIVYTFYMVTLLFGCRYLWKSGVTMADVRAKFAAIDMLPSLLSHFKQKVVV